MRNTTIALPLLLIAGACATPQQRCISDATRDLTVVNHLVAQLQTDIARGYGMQEHQVVVTMWQPCFHHGGWHGHPGGDKGHARGHYDAPDMCLEDTVQTVQRPVAIDLGEAKKTLAELTRKQAALNRAAGPAIAQCQALYPE